MKALARLSIAQWVTVLSWTNFVLIWVIIGLIHGISENWWVSIVILYLPRLPWILPAVILLPLAVKYSWKTSFLNLASILLVLGPVMNWQCGGLVHTAVDRQAPRITLVSCNVQSFRPDFAKVVHEINRINPDIVLFQEAFTDHQLLESLFEGWNVHREDEYLTASKWPLTYIDKCELGARDRTTVVRYAVQTPHGIVSVCNVHQISPQHSLRSLRPWSIITGEGVSEVENESVLRDVEALKARQFTLSAHTGVLRQSPDPKADINSHDNLSEVSLTLVAGDFNMPNDSSYFRKHWGDLNDAYALSAVGYGYTSPCFSNKGFLDNCPWAQVDHILATPNIQVERCWIGTSGGSDHRLIAARVRLPHPATNLAAQEAAK